MRSRSRPTRRVLHVLPHPGGGGETYVSSLDRMRGYSSERAYLTEARDRQGGVRALLSRLPHVYVRAKHSDVVHVHGEMASLLCLPILALKPSVVTLHGLNFVRRSSGAKLRLARRNLRLIVAAASTTICVSNAERDEVLSMIGETAGRTIAAIPNGVDALLLPSEAERLAVRNELGLRDEVVVAWVGALESPKDPVPVAQAVVSVAASGVPIRLLVVGSGGLATQLEELVDTREHIRLMGERDDVSRILQAADMFALSSIREGLPYALLEAMAAGIPPIVSDYPGAAEVVGDAGVIVPRTAEGFAAPLAQLARDSSGRKALGARARSRATTLYSIDRMVAETSRVYDAISR